MKPATKLIVIQIVSVLALIAAFAMGQTAAPTLTIPATLPAGTYGLSPIAQPIIVTAPTTQPVAPPVAPTLSNGSPMPGPANTGPVPGTVLTTVPGMKVSTAGAAIQGFAFTSNVEIAASNVTIKNCTFTMNNAAGGSPGGNYNALQIDSAAQNVTVQNCTFTGGGPGTVQIFSQSGANNLQLLNLNIYDTPTTPFQLAGSATISGCWEHQIGWNALGMKSNPSKPTFTGIDHVDGIYFEKGPFLTVTGNNFDTRGNPTVINGTSYAISNVLIFTIPYATGDVVGPVTVQNNYLDGGGWIFSLCGQGAASITNNTLGPDESYSPPYINTNFIGGPWTWGGNTTPAGAAIPIPTGLTPAGTAPTSGTNGN